MKSIQQNLIAMLKEHSFRKHLTIVVGMIAIATVFSVVWSLHINGITLASDDPTCGLQEHAHTEACYDWVALDGTEEIDSTEGTEAAELVDGAEAIEDTETAEATESAGTTFSAESAATADETDGASVSTETAETSETASGDTEEGTESVTDDTEEGTESLTEDATEDATEGTTEETESSQPGDTKVVDGVTYVYELVCGQEEHVHTDECYPVDTSEDDADSSDDAEEANDSENSVDSSDVNGSTSEDNSEGANSEESAEEATEDEEIVSSATTKLMTASTDDEEDSEEEVIVSSSGTLLASSADLGSVGEDDSSDYYNFADKVSTSKALASLGNYVIYAEIEDEYYLVDGNGNLSLLTNSSTTDDVLSWYADDDIDDYIWGLSESGSSNYLYNSANGHYLSPSTTRSVTGTSVSTDEYVDLTTISDGQVVAVTVSGATVSSGSGKGYFYIRLYQSDSAYFYTRTVSGNARATLVGGGKISNSENYTGDGITYFGLGLTYVVLIARDGDDYTIIIYDETNGYVKFSYTLTDTALTDGTIIQFSPGATSYDLTVDVLDSYSVSAVYNTIASAEAVTVDNSDDGITIGLFQSTDADKKSLYGSFDITYSFTNKGNYGATDGESDNWRNYVVKLEDSNGYQVFARADAYAWIYTDKNYTTGSSTSAAWESGGAFAGDDDWAAWLSLMNDGVDMTVNITWDNNTKKLNVTATGGGATVTTVFDLNDYGFASDGNITLYLTGEYCNLSNITRTDNSIQEYVYDSITYTVSDSLYLMNYSTTAQEITITADTDTPSDAWYGSYTNSNNTVWNLFAELNRVNAVEWITSDGSALTNSDASATCDSGAVTIGSTEGAVKLYFASIREFTAYFDGSNGGNYSSYKHSTYTDNIQETVTTYNMDETGTYFYIVIPTVALTDTETDGTATNERANVTLAGWLDIYNAKYYSLGTTVEIAYSTTTDLTVCYADWVAADYDGGSENDTYYNSNGLDTSGFITTNVFDYNDLFNTYSAYLSSKATSASSYAFGGSKETWLVSYYVDSTSITNLYGNVGWGFMFIKAGGSALLNTSDRNSVLTDGRDQINVNNDEGATTGILSSTSTRTADLLTALFGTDTNTTYSYIGKTYLGTGNYLYQYDSTSGYYYFDSDVNAAFYNQSDGRFYLYNYKVALSDTDEEGNYTSNGDFFPFSYDETQSKGVTENGTTRLSASNIDYYFGMSSEISFYLPENAGKLNDGSNSNQTTVDGYSDMVFKFSGDDDVWVVLDYGESTQQLLLDIGGVHGQVYGEINFSTGEVRVVDTPTATFSYTDTTSSETVTDTIVTYDDNGIIGINENYTGTDLVTTTTLSSVSSGTHTLTVFYTERGASQSNAAIYFNISPVYSVELTKVGNNTTDLLSGVTFNLYKSSSFTDENLVGTYTTDAYGNLERINALFPRTTYYLVETNAADGYPLSSKYIKIYVNTNRTATVTVCDSDGNEIETLECAVGNTTTAPSSYKYLLQSLSVSTAHDSTYGSYIIAAFTYANYLEYELPTTGSTGIFPYERAGILLVLASMLGLVVIALSDFVQRRRMRMKAYKRGYNEEKAGREHRYAGTRDRPRQRNRIYGRDAPASFSDGSQERSRGTGPGTE